MESQRRSLAGLSLISAAAALIALLLLWELAASASISSASRSAIGGFQGLALFGGKAPGVASAALVVGRALWNSAIRVLVCLIIGYPLGALAGALLYSLPFTPGGRQSVLMPLRATPLLALVPLFNIWFGDSERGMYFYLVFAITVFVASGALSTLQRIPFAIAEQAKLLDVRFRRQLFSIHLPAIHYSCSDVREALASFIWAFALAAEFLSADSGLGNLVVQSYQNSSLGQLVALLAIYAALALVSIAAVRILESVFHWNRGGW